jgi:hypothetical protein
MHGGKSLKWFGSPRYRHGLRSKYDPVPLLVKAQEARSAVHAWAEQRVAEELGK